MAYWYWFVLFVITVILYFALLFLTVILVFFTSGSQKKDLIVGSSRNIGDAESTISRQRPSPSEHKSRQAEAKAEKYRYIAIIVIGAIFLLLIMFSIYLTHPDFYNEIFTFVKDLVNGLKK